MKRLATEEELRPLVIGHRGACGYLPEHTLASYRLAIGMDADFIEPDLVLTRDGRLIARHDNELGCSTDIAQHPEYADRYTTKLVDGMQRQGWFCEDFELAEIKRLACVCNQADSYRLADSDPGPLPIPTLEEILALVRDEENKSGLKVGIYVETKLPTYYAMDGHYLDGTPIRKSIGRMLIEVLQQESFTSPERIFIQSFEVANLIELHDQIMPDYGVELPLIQLLGNIAGELILPEGNFSIPYDFIYHRNRRDDLEKYYAELPEIVEGLTQRGYQALSLPDAIDWMAQHYATGIAMWIDNLISNTMLVDSSIVDYARKCDMQVHAYPLCETVSSTQSRNSAWRERLKSQAMQLFERGVDGIFFNQPDIGVEARRLYLQSVKPSY
ncbi:glycerophosphodiester phosphodiesterase family protein [Candidatus Thiodiazotropha sp. CDECU1]|uniref:glycerophosphodiester phosphodiesterase family protein n=1 Tax=Candidatus Thiodiazotropha sp. CDECU1 TaxID=3065865 RepID=UPI00292F2EA1|nr:glycerophosphodiester phosphodiesterase family protein [Candidatus Thiodiazotropha sp. CDECU1]